MADKSSQLILNALSRAAAGGAPLHGNKTVPGLFPATAAGKDAASRCQEEGYLAILPAQFSSSNGQKTKAPPEAWGLSEKGVAYLLGQVSPRQVLNDLVSALDNRAAQLDDLFAHARQTRDQFTGLRSIAEIALRQLIPLDAANPAGGLNALFQSFLQTRDQQPQPSQTDKPHVEDAANGRDRGIAGTSAIIQHLNLWQQSGTIDDCPLPDLYRQASVRAPGLTMGEFHDALRRLHETGQIYLHPWTGPLYDLPEPPFALLIGHEVAYYASLRQVDCPLRNGA